MSTNDYSWAENRSKLERAITEVNDSGVEFSEEAVIVVYRRLLGVVYEDRVPKVKEVKKEEPKEEKKEEKKETKSKK